MAGLVFPFALPALSRLPGVSNTQLQYPNAISNKENETFFMFSNIFLASSFHSHHTFVQHFLKNMKTTSTSLFENARFDLIAHMAQLFYGDGILSRLF